MIKNISHRNLWRISIISLICNFSDIMMLYLWSILATDKRWLLGNNWNRWNVNRKMKKEGKKIKNKVPNGSHPCTSWLYGHNLKGKRVRRGRERNGPKNKIIRNRGDDMERRAEQWDIHKNKLIIEQEDGASRTPCGGFINVMLFYGEGASTRRNITWIGPLIQGQRLPLCCVCYLQSYASYVQQAEVTNQDH